MSYETMRRSSRIPKELAILLTGSDVEGKSFSEMTKTVLLSRHGAGIVSTYKLYAEQEVIIRYLDTNKEAYVRVVGRIGDEGEIYTYGVAFVDPNNVDFWGIDFPVVSQKEKEARRVVLECSTCSLRETVEHMEVEADVLMINEGIVRYCKICHDSTLWKRSAGVPEEEPVLVGAVREPSGRSFVGATSTAIEASEEASASSPASAPVPGPAAVSVPSFAGVATTASELTSASSPTQIDQETFSDSSASSPPAEVEAPAAAPAPPPTPAVAPAIKPENRRKHSRMKVTYKACIRRSGFPEDVVTCEDMSRGGICFKSRKRYYPDVEIEVAVPYSPGGNAIFVPARIAWVVELEKDRQFKCGVAYRPTSRAS